MASNEVADESAARVKRLTEEGLRNPASLGRQLGSMRGDRGVTASCVTRWCQFGIRIADGSTVKLEAIRIGTRWASSWPAVLRFLTAQQQQADRSAAPETRTARARSKASESAERQLVAAGC